MAAEPPRPWASWTTGIERALAPPGQWIDYPDAIARRLPLAALLVGLLSGCPSGPPPGVIPEDCEDGFVLDQEACVPRFDLCTGAERPVFGGGCAPVGVPVDGCAAGFTHDGVGGCTPVLPPDPCPAGTFATPGDTACRPVGDCGTGTWGELPVDADTVYVDQSYAGASSDGSASQPFKTIGAALASAPPADTLVAVAAGTYVEAVSVNRPVRLWGVCADRVELRGPPGTRYQVDVVGTSVDLSGLSITGPGAGLSLYQVPQGRVRAVRVHDTTQEGLDLQRSGTSSPVLFQDVLVEGAREHGALVLAADITFERVVIRGSRPGNGYDGVGLFAFAAASDGKRSQVTLDHVRLADNTRVGLAVFESDATVRGTIIEDTHPGPGDRSGMGIDTSDGESGVGSTLDIETSVIRRNHTVGIYIQGTLSLRRSVVEGMRPRVSDQLAGWGILVDPLDDGTASVGVLEDSVVRDTHEIGVAGFSSELTTRGLLVQRVLTGTRLSPPPGTGITLEHKSGFEGGPIGHFEATLVEDCADRGISVTGGTATVVDSYVRQVAASVDGFAGVGLAGQFNPDYGTQTSLSVLRTVVEDVRLAGILGEGTAVTVDDSLIRRVTPELKTGAYGAGVFVVPQLDVDHPSSLTLRRSLVSATFEVGVGILGATATLEDVVVRGVAASEGAVLGDGITAITVPTSAGGFLPAVVSITGGMVDDAERAGLSVFGAEVSMSGLVLRCNGLDLNTSDTIHGRAGGTVTRASTLVDDGHNACGCETLSASCRAENEALAPTPSPVVDGEESAL